MYPKPKAGDHKHRRDVTAWTATTAEPRLRLLGEAAQNAATVTEAIHRNKDIYQRQKDAA